MSEELSCRTHHRYLEAWDHVLRPWAAILRSSRESSSLNTRFMSIPSIEDIVANLKVCLAFRRRGRIVRFSRTHTLENYGNF